MIQKTLELCEIILTQPEFAQLRGQIDAFQGDDGVIAQYRNLTERGSELQSKQDQGMMPEADEVLEFEQLRDAFLRNPVARGFLDAQQTIHHVRETINKYVTRTFELGRTPQPEDFHSCSCNSGCGCG